MIIALGMGVVTTTSYTLGVGKKGSALSLSAGVIHR